MSTNEDILAAVQQLDPANDEHWTADGQPRLDAVENLLGSDTSRKAVTNAAPEFTRGHAQSLVDDEQDEETAGPTEEVGQEPPVPDNGLGEDAAGEDAAGEDVTGEDAAGEDAVGEDNQATDNQAANGDDAPTDEAATNDEDDPEDDPLASGPAEEEALMDQDIQDADDRVVQIREALNEGSRALAEAEEEAQAVRDAKNRAFPPLTPAEAIQEFQASEHKRRAERAGDGKTASQLDQALTARKKARVRGAHRVTEE